MYCSRCGREIPEGNAFCGYCGASTAAPAGQAPSPPAYYAAPTLPAAAPKRRVSALPWVLGGLGLVGVVALVVVLLLVLGGNGESAAVEKVVRDYCKALEDKDADLLLEVMEPDFRRELENALGKDYKDFLDDYYFPELPDDLKVRIEKMETKIRGDRATVKVLEGTMSYTGEDGRKVSLGVSESDEEEVELAKVDGKWYLAKSWLEDNGFAPDDLEALSGGGKDNSGKDSSGKDNSGKDTSGGKDSSGGSAAADPETAMLDYLGRNYPSTSFDLIEMVASGNQAFGMALLDSGYLGLQNLLAEKKSSGWQVVQAGEDVDHPWWHDDVYGEVGSAMLDFVAANAEPSLTISIKYVLVRGNEAAGLVECTSTELEQPLVLMRRGSGGWYGVDIGTGIDIPYWYELYLQFMNGF